MVLVGEPGPVPGAGGGVVAIVDVPVRGCEVGVGEVGDEGLAAGAVAVGLGAVAVGVVDVGVETGVGVDAVAGLEIV